MMSKEATLLIGFGIIAAAVFWVHGPGPATVVLGGMLIGGHVFHTVIDAFNLRAFHPRRERFTEVIKEVRK